ncbi:MAG: hypothetical protein M5R36_22540 [Deltaproteobacteria bacterium]|nr:hypothetical protein [Deltaproteobacteria bacterium]
MPKKKVLRTDAEIAGQSQLHREPEGGPVHDRHHGLFQRFNTVERRLNLAREFAQRGAAMVFVHPAEPGDIRHVDSGGEARAFAGDTHDAHVRVQREFVEARVQIADDLVVDGIAFVGTVERQARVRAVDAGQDGFHVPSSSVPRALRC